MTINLVGVYLIGLLRLLNLCVCILIEDVLILVVVVKTVLRTVLVDGVRTLVHVTSLGWYSGRVSNLRPHGWTKWRLCRGPRGRACRGGGGGSRGRRRCGGCCTGSGRSCRPWFYALW